MTRTSRAAYTITLAMALIGCGGDPGSAAGPGFDSGAQEPRGGASGSGAAMDAGQGAAGTGGAPGAPAGHGGQGSPDAGAGGTGGTAGAGSMSGAGARAGTGGGAGTGSGAGGTAPCTIRNSCGACGNICKTGDTCAPDNTCKRQSGQPCTSNAQCAIGYCVGEACGPMPCSVDPDCLYGQRCLQNTSTWPSSPQCKPGNGTSCLCAAAA